MIDNKGLIQNGDQLSKIINDVLSNILVNIDLESMSKYVLKRKFEKINDYINTVNDKLQERVFTLNKDTAEIVFNVGEHLFKYAKLNVTFIFMNNTNELLNKEVNIVIPKSMFHKYLSNGKAVIEPYIDSVSESLYYEPIYYSVEQYQNNTTSSIETCLKFNLKAEDVSKYDTIMVIVDSLVSNFSEITLSEYTHLKTFVLSTEILPSVNIGYNTFLKDDGTIVRSNIVKNISLVTKEKMDEIIENGNGNPCELSLVPVSVDESDRLLKLKVNIKTVDTRLILSKNNNQSKSYKVNWGDGVQDDKISHTFTSTGEFYINIYNRIDDLLIHSNNEVDILEMTIPSGYRAPTEWNEPIISYPFNGGSVLNINYLGTSFPAGLFIFGDKIIRVNGLIKSSTITSVPEKALSGLVNTTQLDAGDLYKKVTSVHQNSFSELINLRVMRSIFKDSELTSLPTSLLDNLESLEDITSFAENSKISSIPENFGVVCTGLKVADYAFKNISTLLDKDISAHVNSFISDKPLLRSIKGLYEDTPAIINANKETLSKFNQLANIMDLSFVFKNTKFNNEDLVFTLSNLENLNTIASIFEGVTTFNINGVLLQNCMNITNEEIDVTNSLKGTTLNFDIVSEDDLFEDTSVSGEAGVDI